jgi:hypothetical protein
MPSYKAVYLMVHGQRDVVIAGPVSHLDGAAVHGFEPLFWHSSIESCAMN